MSCLPDLERALVEAIDRHEGSRRRTRSLELCIAVATVLGLTAIATATPWLGSLDDAVRAGRRPPAPDAKRELPLISGRGSRTLAQYRGHPLVVVFYASWCLPCRQQALAVDRLERGAARQTSTAALLIAFKDSPASAHRFAAENGLTLTTVSDPRSTLADAFATNQIPATFVLDSQSRVRAIFRGVIPSDSLARALRNAEDP